MKKRLYVLLFFSLIVLQLIAQSDSTKLINGGLILPPKFKAELLIDNLGKTRHLFITPQNNIYVRLARLKEGKGTIYLEQKNGTAQVKSRFGNFQGTGVYIKKGYLYTSSNSEVFRYKLNENSEVIDPDSPEKLVTGMVDKGTHETKSIVVDDEGNMYIPIGSPSNSCQVVDRQQGSPGKANCPDLAVTGGVWMFAADKLNQTVESAVHYATGLRNVVAVDINKETNTLYVMQHGRDQLTMFPQYYTVKQNAELPGECMFALKKGDNAGWPYIFYDLVQKKNIVSPEYGGDGKIEGPEQFIKPAAAYPAHMAPNGLLFYTGNQFPERYKNGAFIAFHGSWNRAPEPQKGYFVVFQPFKNGKPYGDWEVFADNFAGSSEKVASGRADRRPCGLAQGPDGALYVTDDVKGAIFKITYEAKAELSSAPKSKSATLKAPASVVKKQSTPKLLAPKTSNPTKKPAAQQPMASRAFASGKAIYMQSCVACHMVDGKGVESLNPPLARTSYVLGSPQRLINVLLKGLSQQPVDGELYSNAMPPFNYLTDKQIADVLTYVRKSFGNKASDISIDQVKAVRAKKN